MTRGCQVCPVVRVCPDFLVLPSRAKDSRDSLGFQGVRELLASPDRREKLESWDSPARLEQGVMMEHLVYLASLENLVVLEEKVNLEIVMLILEPQELKASREIQASPVAVAMTAPPVITAIQEARVSLERRELLVKEDGLE